MNTDCVPRPRDEAPTFQCKRYTVPPLSPILEAWIRPFPGYIQCIPDPPTTATLYGPQTSLASEIVARAWSPTKFCAGLGASIQRGKNENNKNARGDLRLETIQCFEIEASHGEPICTFRSPRITEVPPSPDESSWLGFTVSIPNVHRIYGCLRHMLHHRDPIRRRDP